MAPLHHHYQKKQMHESKIVARFWIVGILLAVLSNCNPKTSMTKEREITVLGAAKSGIGCSFSKRRVKCFCIRLW